MRRVWLAAEHRPGYDHADEPEPTGHERADSGPLRPAASDAKATGHAAPEAESSEAGATEAGATEAGSSGTGSSVAGVLAEVRRLPDRLAGLDVAGWAASELAEGLVAVTRAETALATVKARLLRAAEQARLADQTGATDMVAWSRTALGESGRQAARNLRLARGLDRLPRTADALARGELGREQAEQLVRATDRGTLGRPDQIEDQLLDLARTTTPERLRDEVTRREATTDRDRLERDDELARSRRSVRRWRRDDGMYEGHWLLDPVAGAYVDTMLAAYTTLDPSGTPPELRRRPEQRTADALTQAAKTALDTGPTDTGTRRPHLTVVVPVQTLACPAERHRPGRPDPDGVVCRCTDPAETDGTGPLPRHTLEHLTCDATLTRVLTADSRPLDVGRATRAWTGSQRRALVTIDGGCRFPGCDRPPSWTEIHHIRFWRHQGPTDLENGCLLCLHHHRTIHRRGWKLTMDPTTRTVTVTTPTRDHTTSHPTGLATRTPPLTPPRAREDETHSHRPDDGGAGDRAGSRHRFGPHHQDADDQLVLPGHTRDPSTDDEPVRNGDPGPGDDTGPDGDTGPARPPP